MNIIIIDHEPYSFRKNDHYYIDEFLSDGWNVEYWEINNALGYLKDVEYSYKEENDIVRYYNNISKIISSINSFNPEDTIFIMETFYNNSTFDIYKVLAENQFKWVKIDYYLNPTGYLNPSVTFKKRLLNLNSKSIIEKVKRLYFLLKYKNKNFNIPDILFVTGSNRSILNKAKEVKSLDYFDVEIFQKIKHLKSPLPYKYILFLDIMLINHPDFQRRGYKQFLDKEEYFRKLTSFFDVIENKTGMPIVIASHPKADYTTEFGSRLCIKHKTAELSQHCEYVLSHGSLSISFALFARKPIVYIYSEKLFNKTELLKVLLYRMDKACDYLGVSKINIDNSINGFNMPLNVDVNKYDKFLDLLYRSSNNNSSVSNFSVLKNAFESLLKIV